METSEIIGCSMLNIKDAIVQHNKYITYMFSGSRLETNIGGRKTLPRYLADETPQNVVFVCHPLCERVLEVQSWSLALDCCHHFYACSLDGAALLCTES